MVSATVLEEEEGLDDSIPDFDPRYRLIRPLARVTGGGHVYAAEHVFTRRRCAIKVFEPSASERLRKRTRREMDALARVQGPGIVQFCDAGEIHGRLYLVLELLEGRTLAGLLAAKGRLDIEHALAVSHALATALASCHARGVVHRDIKPANVFVTSKSTVHLLDFGIAKIVAHEPIEKLTQENALLGTPEYMAPEALMASPDVGPEADQWGLAVTIHECLTGIVPFEGDIGELLPKVMSKKRTPLRELRPEVPAAFADVIDRALSLEPHDRFAGMEEMRDALDRARISANNKATVADAPLARQKSSGRRRHLRAPYVTLARVRRADGSSVDGRIEEVSESGFQFVGDRALGDGENVVVRFALPASGRITEARATSRWSHSTRGLMAAGFEFTALADDALGELRKYVSILCAG